VATLKRENAWENTLLFFISDNGGPLAQTANNTPLRGGKHQDYEGGIRVPFLVCWPAKLKPGESQAVVSSLDILPTSLAAAGIEVPTDKRLDGMNLLPILQGHVPVPERNLFWCSGSDEGWWAVRSGDWKVVGDKARLSLFDLSKDTAEAKDLSKTEPNKLAELTRLHDAWLAEMPNPMKAGNKKWTPGAPEKSKKNTREQKRKARDEERKKKQTPK
jgi:arylsulfatase A-like enzyme